MAVLKDDVKARSTWTSNDSLLFGEEPFKRAVTRRLAQGTSDAGWIDISAKGGYVEAQIWGELGKEDVSYYMVPKGADQEALARLKAHGLPIFEYAVKKKDGRVRRIPVRRIQ